MLKNMDSKKIDDSVKHLRGLGSYNDTKDAAHNALNRFKNLDDPKKNVRTLIGEKNPMFKTAHNIKKNPSIEAKTFLYNGKYVPLENGLSGGNSGNVSVRFGGDGSGKNRTISHTRASSNYGTGYNTKRSGIASPLVTQRNLEVFDNVFRGDSTQRD